MRKVRLLLVLPLSLGMSVGTPMTPQIVPKRRDLGLERVGRARDAQDDSRGCVRTHGPPHPGSPPTPFLSTLSDGQVECASVSQEVEEGTSI